MSNAISIYVFVAVVAIVCGIIVLFLQMRVNWLREGLQSLLDAEYRKHGLAGRVRVLTHFFTEYRIDADLNVCYFADDGDAVSLRHPTGGWKYLDDDLGNIMVWKGCTLSGEWNTMKNGCIDERVAYFHLQTAVRELEKKEIG